MKGIVGAIFLCGVAVAQPNWVQLSPTTVPPGREAAAMVFDQARQQVVMFGGAVVSGSSFIEGADTWVWDGQNWQQKSPATAPPGRFRHCMMYDPRFHNVVMFGGETASAIVGDTWVWDGTIWTSQDPATAPSFSDCYSTFAFDETHQQAILVLPGPSSGVPGSRTWSWDGATWTQLFPAHIPTLFGSGEQMVFDRARGELLLMARSDNPLDNTKYSTWSWNGTDWIRKSPATDLPPYDFNPSQMLYDAVHNYLVTFTIKNTGNSAANVIFQFSATAVTLANGTSTTTNTFPAGQFSSILAGATGTFQAQFPAGAGSGAHSFSTQGSYSTISGATGNWNAAVRSLLFP